MNDIADPILAEAPAASPALTPSAAPHHVFLIDGSGFIFRAYHALPPMTRPDGTPVNAVFGCVGKSSRPSAANPARAPAA